MQTVASASRSKSPKKRTAAQAKRTRAEAAPKKAEARLGSQTPSRNVVLPYSETRGQEAVDLYNSTGRTAQEWQALLLYDLLAINGEELFVHTKFGYAVPRRRARTRGTASIRAA